MELLTIVGTVTQIVTLFTLASGFPPCLHMYRTRDTSNIPFVFFVLGLLNAMTGVVYGYMVNLMPLMFINSLGLVFNVVYVLMYLAVCKSQLTSFLQTVGTCSSLFIYYQSLVYLGFPQSKMNDMVGSFMSLVALCLVSSPFLETLHCIKIKNSDGISRIMLYAGTSCCLSWFTYGLLLNDIFICAPNMVGLCAGASKFAVISIYGKKKTE